jgi:hypothetical protein
MPAIILYLGDTLDLLPANPSLRALTIKIVNDANDVIDEITQNGGREMWTKKKWEEFVPRLQKWMSFWEETGRRHGLKADAGFLLGGNAPGIADIVTATLWSTMTDRFAAIGEILEEAAPMTASLTRRISTLPALVKLAAKARKDYGVHIAAVRSRGHFAKSSRPDAASVTFCLASGLMLALAAGDELEIIVPPSGLRSRCRNATSDLQCSIDRKEYRLGFWRPANGESHHYPSWPAIGLKRRFDHP